MNVHKCWGMLKLGLEGGSDRGSPNGANQQGFGFLVKTHHNRG